MKKMPPPDPADFGYSPEEFGADEIRGVPDGDGYHWTAFRRGEGQISWNTDRSGNYREFSPTGRFGPKIHLSDRNVKENDSNLKKEVTHVWVEEPEDEIAEDG
jgi:hypothetical protein